MRNLKEIRLDINEIDAEMLDLFKKRMKLIKEVALYKKKYSLPISDLEREKELLNMNLELIEDKDIKEYYQNYLENMFTISKSYQEKLTNSYKIAYPKEINISLISHSDLYESNNLIAKDSFLDVYRTVEKGECDLCLLPLENENNEEIGDVLDLLFFGSLYINKIITLNDKFSRIAVFSKTLKLNTLVSDTNRHFILVFTILNEAGSLAKALKIIGDYNFNIQALKNRPLKDSPWDYYFFIELDGDVNSKEGQLMIAKLAKICDCLKISGNYKSQKLD